MKKLLLAISLLFSGSAMAQKVDLDRFYFDVKYQRLPSVNVPFDNRTYGIRVTTNGPISSYLSNEIIYDKLNIAGWKKIESNPTVGIDFSLEDFVFKGAEGKNETVDRKNSAGKVIGTDTYYWIEAKYVGRGIARIKGPTLPKEEVKKEEAKKEEVKPVNKFLVNAVIKKVEPVITADKSESNNISFNNELSYQSEKRSSSSGASTDFTNNKEAIFSQKMREFVDDAIRRTSVNINNTYGFLGLATQELVWILDAKSDEGKTQIEAVEAVKVIFQGMKPDEPLTQVEANLKPLIEYFESLKTKYASDDKPGRKMRYSAFYNLGKIYLAIDQPDKAIKEGEGLIANEYDSKDGKRIIEEANSLIELFQKTKFVSRHNPSNK